MPTEVAGVDSVSVEGWALSEGVAGHRVLDGDRQLRWSQVARGLRDGTLGPLLGEALRASPMQAFFWECVPWAADDDPPFEFVLVDAPSLAGVRPDSAAFAEHIGDCNDGLSVRTFDNLGGDARLVAPCPCGPPHAYPHLAAFVRHAPPPQVDALWRALGTALDTRPSTTRWVSTSGLGVYWLHVRIDQRPKYYTHAPYRGMQ